jgi:hypothetical protein
LFILDLTVEAFLGLLFLPTLAFVTDLRVVLVVVDLALLELAFLLTVGFLRVDAVLVAVFLAAGLDLTVVFLVAVFLLAGLSVFLAALCLRVVGLALAAAVAVVFLSPAFVLAATFLTAAIAFFAKAGFLILVLDVLVPLFLTVAIYRSSNLKN